MGHAEGTATPLFGIVALVLQVLFIALFAGTADYENVNTNICTNASLNTRDQCEAEEACAWDAGSSACVVGQFDGGVDHYYPLYQDVHVMIFIGFGFLMTFLFRYGYSAVGYNFLIGAMVLQWSVFTNAFWHRAISDGFHHVIHMNIETLVASDFAAGAALISFGAVLGKTTPLQLLVMVFFEMIFYSLNETIGVTQYEAVDMGGSMFVHAFGAYFGLAVSAVLGPSVRGTRCSQHKDQRSTRTSDLFAMIGTLFLWIFWPSFNGALAGSEAQHRVIVNTVIALGACCVSAFAWSNILRPGHKFDMVDIQNATLAGGVAVGSSADLIIQPWGATLIGLCAGFLSVMGYVYLTPWLERRGLHDTCGVHNLHGMPGVMGGIGGTISAAVADSLEYGTAIGSVYPARGTDNPRSAAYQAAYQLAALVTTVAIAICGGLLVGLIVKKALPAPREAFQDRHFWEVPEEGEEEPSVARGKSGSAVHSFNGTQMEELPAKHRDSNV